MASNMTDHMEIVAPLNLLVKDHKGWTKDDRKPPPSRPACEGKVGVTRYLSEAVSIVLEPLSGHSRWYTKVILVHGVTK